MILSLLGTFALTEIGRGWAMQVAVNLVGIGSLLLMAFVLEWYRGATAKVPAGSPTTSEVKTA